VRLLLRVFYFWLTATCCNISCKKPENSLDQELAATRDYYNSPAVIGAFLDPAAFGKYRWHASFRIKTADGLELDETQYLMRNSKFSAQTRILDWGCGMGWLAVRLAKKCRCRVTGLNISPVQIQEAKKWSKANGVQHLVAFDLYDGKTLPYQNETFDIVYSQEALVNAPDKNLTYSEIFRVLKSGGELSVQDWYADASNQSWAEFAKPIDQEHKSTLTTMQNAGRLLKLVGFEDIQNQDIRDLSPGSLAQAFPNQAFAAALRNQAFTVAFTSARKPKIR